MKADYHHIPKVLDLVAAIGPNSLLEAHGGTPLYAPLCRGFLPQIKRVEEADAMNAHQLRSRFDLVLVSLEEQGDEHASLDHVRALIAKHRGVLVIAPKSQWEKADIAGVGPSLFVQDSTGIIAYLANPSDIKRVRRTLLKHRVGRHASFTPTISDMYKTMQRVRKKKTR
jgi:hypothetical protein